MQQDCLGNPISGNGASLRAVDDFIEGYLGYETRAERIIAQADADPGACIANVYAGMLWMLLEAPEAASRAAKYLYAAETSAAGATRREQLNVAALRAWVDDDLSLAAQICDQVTDEFSRDLVAVKMQQYFAFNRGNAPEMLRVALKVAADCADVPHMHGMSAFAYEQCHLLEQAEAEASIALDMRLKEPWAQHALAHVLLTRGQIEDGARFLESMQNSWDGLNSFMLTHLWWHLALVYLSQGRNREVLELYDRSCWGIAKDYSQDQVGAVSLLARFELAGIDVGPRWQDLADHLQVRAHDTVQPFLTAQYLYGLARAGRAEAATLLESVKARAHHARQFDRGVWLEVALPACEGLQAYARGDFDQAWQRLVLSSPRMSELGGSHAQRDLFEQILLDCARKSGRTVLAQQMLETRRIFDPDGVVVNNALGDVYARLGLPELAQQARDRAVHTLSLR